VSFAAFSRREWWTECAAPDPEGGQAARALNELYRATIIRQRIDPLTLADANPEYHPPPVVPLVRVKR